MKLPSEYINDAGLVRLRQFKYVAGEWTYLDHMLNPYWNFVSELVPLVSSHYR